MKTCIAINKLEELDISVDKYIIGIKEYNYLPVLEIDEKEIDKYLNKNIIISLNKLYENDELKDLLELLRKLENKVYGIIFDDVCVYNLVKNNDLNINLLWGNIHATCNYNSINEWYKLGVKECIISPDITIEDILEIRKYTKSNLYVNIYGRVNISTSKRKFLSNYFEYINEAKKDNLYYIKNDKTKLPIYERNNNSFILSEVINGLKFYKLLEENEINNVIFNSFGIDNIEKIINTKEDKNNNYLGFFETDSIYKVGDVK